MATRPRLLVLLDAEEKSDFFPEPLWTELLELAPDAEWLDTRAHAPAEWVARWQASAPEVLVAGWTSSELPTPLPPSVRYICYLCGSVKRLVSRAQLEQGLLVTNWGNSVSRTIAEAALLHVLSCLRVTTQWTIGLHVERTWQPAGALVPASLFGRRVGLHGFGAIARELVQLLRPFGCKISAFAPDLDAATQAAFDVRAATSLEALFAEHDVIVDVAPLNAQTTGSVTEALLRRIPAGGVFVNVGRGHVVDEAALARVAQERGLRVGLDVFIEEPLPVDSPLRGLTNVSLTPHLAGPTPDRRRDAGAFALRNLRAYASGRPLSARITPAVYDSIT